MAAVILWLEREELGELVGLGWWWLGWGGRMDEGKGFQIFFSFKFCFVFLQR